MEVSLKFAEIGGRGVVLAVMRDIEERKRAEAELAEEKERLRVTLVSIGDGVIVTDTEGRIVMLNRVAEKLTGWNNQEATGKPLREVFNIIDEDSREACESPVQEVLKSGKIVGLANHALLVSRDGSERSIADSGAPIFDRENKTIGVILVFRDVTEKKRTAAELEKIKKLEAVGVLAGGIAHDFNNILTAILGNINLAKMRLDANDKTRSLLESAEKASIRAKDLTQQLLTFSKGGEPVKKTTSIEKIITESAAFILRGSSIATKFDIPADLWLVDIDTGQMSRVIQNIVLNARQAMVDGGKIQITCENIPDIAGESGLKLDGKKFIKITIRDEGSGIPEKILDKIFDPYFSTKSDGSGLGLAITHSIVRKHGGNILVQSRLGKGTTFIIYLPASGQPAKPIIRENRKSLLNDSRARFLVMDDDEMIRELAREMLEQMGHEVLTATNGDEALLLYKHHHLSGSEIDVVIMDLTIPGGMGGKEAVGKLLEIDPNAKILVASGYSNDPVMANCREYGFQGAVTKPFKFSELQKVVNRVLAN